jgi:hypothetical protein
MTTGPDEIFAGYPALKRHFLPALERARNPLAHPLISRLTTRGMVGIQVLSVLEDLVTSAEGVNGFAQLIRKLAIATTPAAFWSVVTELAVISRLVRIGGTSVGLVPTANTGRPDAVATLADHPVYVEITRLTSMNPRQRAQDDRLAELAAAVEGTQSPFYVTFVPEGEYSDEDIDTMAAIIRDNVTALQVADTLVAGAAETLTFSAPSFGLRVSLKGSETADRPGTPFSLSGMPVLKSPDGRDERRLLDTIVAKYRQCVADALNAIVIHTVSDGLDGAAQTLKVLTESPRPNLSAVVLLSSWPGRSRVLPNGNARLTVPSQVLEKLEHLCRIDDEMWTRPAAGGPSSC